MCDNKVYRFLFQPFQIWATWVTLDYYVSQITVEAFFCSNSVFIQATMDSYIPLESVLWRNFKNV